MYYGTDFLRMCVRDLASPQGTKKTQKLKVKSKKQKKSKLRSGFIWYIYEDSDFWVFLPKSSHTPPGPGLHLLLLLLLLLLPLFLPLFLLLLFLHLLLLLLLLLIWINPPPSPPLVLPLASGPLGHYLGQEHSDYSVYSSQMVRGVGGEVLPVILLTLILLYLLYIADKWSGVSEARYLTITLLTLLLSLH